MKDAGALFDREWSKADICRQCVESESEGELVVLDSNESLELT